MTGSTRKPAAIRRAEGNPGKTPIPNEIVSRGVPLAPKALSAEERRMWQVTYDSMPVGVYTASDSSTLERFVKAWARWRQCEREIRKRELVDPLNRGWLMQQRVAADELYRLGSQLGLSPIARTHLTTEGREDADPLELLLDGRRDGSYSVRHAETTG